MGNACRTDTCSGLAVKSIEDGATGDFADYQWTATAEDPTKDGEGVSVEALKLKDDSPVMAPEISTASTEFENGDSVSNSAAGGSAADVAEATAVADPNFPEAQAALAAEEAALRESQAAPAAEASAEPEKAAPAATKAAGSEAAPPPQDASGAPKAATSARASSGGPAKAAAAKASQDRKSVSRKSTAKAKVAPAPKMPPRRMTREEKERAERQQRMRERIAAEKEKKAEFERNKDKYMQMAKDVMSGKFKQEGGGGGGAPPPGTNLRIIMPTPADRENTRNLVLGQFRGKYAKMNGGAANCPSASNMEPAPANAATSLYSASETQGLQIKGGHVNLPRPAKVKLPTDFRKPLNKEFTISLENLQSYHSGNERMLVSVYGDVFDVSDRPDKYGPEAPYEWMTGHDLTWGFVSGRDVPETVDQCYDLWKVAPESLRDNKIKLIYAWVAFYEYEYGKPVAKLDLYKNENGLKGPPMEESEDCCIM